MAATVGLDFERKVSVPSVEVRAAIAAALRELGFKISADTLTRVEAKRGSLIGSSLLMKKSMATRVVFEVSSEADGCNVVAHLSDAIPNLGKTWGINRVYRDIFDEVQRRVDLALAKLDPAAAQSFGDARFWSRAAEVAVIEQTNVVSGKLAGGAVEAAGKAIDGSTDKTPAVWKGVDSVTYRSSPGLALLTLAETQADLGIAVLVVSHPGSMPENLSRDVEQFAAGVERQLTAAAGHAVSIDVSDAQRPVLEFLHQQAQIRAELPLRELHTCRSCRLEKITNPEYERIAARNEKIGDIVAGVGATISAKGISPTFVLGQVFKLKKLDPDFVCTRCQGMEADERIVTFCPSCAALMKEVVLRLCPKCKFDFRTKVAKKSMWTALPPKTAEPEAAAGETAPGEVAAVVAEPGAPEPVAAGPEAAPGETAPGEVEPEVAPEPVAPLAAFVPQALPPTPIAPTAAPAPVPPAAAPVPVAPAPAPPAAPLGAAPASGPRAWPSPAAVPLGKPLVGQRGKPCQMCRREYPNLWRVVIATPAGFEERFICGTTFACQMVSLVPAVQV